MKRPAHRANRKKITIFYEYNADGSATVEIVRNGESHIITRPAEIIAKIATGNHPKWMGGTYTKSFSYRPRRKTTRGRSPFRRRK